MASDNGLTGLVRLVCGATLLVAAMCASGCGEYDVGPDPLPGGAGEVQHQAPQGSGPATPS